MTENVNDNVDSNIVSLSGENTKSDVLESLKIIEEMLVLFEAEAIEKEGKHYVPTTALVDLATLFGSIPAEDRAMGFTLFLRELAEKGITPEVDQFKEDADEQT